LTSKMNTENIWTSILSSSSKQSADGSVLSRLFEFRIKLHLMHLATDSYAQHKALGSLYEAVDGFIDGFAETFMGAKGSKKLASSPVTISVSAEGEAMPVLDELQSFIQGQLTEAIGEGETALLNMRDDLLGKVQAAKYMLTLK
jgi:Family of unknown function (DUF5856)